MIIKSKHTFALKTAFYISLIVTLSWGVFFYFTDNPIWWSLIIGATSFPVNYYIIQYRVKKFIQERINNISNDLTLLESSSLASKPVTTDMDTLKSEIEKYAKTKKLEIETLRVREAYRKEFLGNISHELKTPLFTVQGYIETLLDGAIDNKEITLKYLERASKGIDRLSYIIDDLDMITKLEVGNLTLKESTFDIVELIQGVFDLFEMKAAQKKISLTFYQNYTEPIYVNADEDRIKQVVTNLIVNSIKYGKNNGTTEISIEQLIKNKIIVRITDNGEGIEKHNIPRLFERFFRVDKSGSRKEGGSGLGLAIVKHIIEAHNEKIYIESEHGVGSEFSFTIEKATK